MNVIYLVFVGVLVGGTAALLFVVSWDLRDDFASMDRRIERRAARRGRRDGSRRPSSVRR